MLEPETLATVAGAYTTGTAHRELLRLLTAGSVDDGKSTLIGRLLFDTQAIYDDQMAALKRDSARRGPGDGDVDLSLLTDGLRAEREQGITIDVAYRYFATDKRKFIIADCPGHEQYTRNMATGASNCDLAIILIDARHGVMRQTKRHSFIASLLGIRHVVVAVNKMDLVAYSQDVFEGIKQAYTDFSAKLEVTDVRFIPMSALKGDNVVRPSQRMAWYQGETLLHYLESVHIASDRNLIDLRFPVQYVNRPNQDFRGFCGSIASGVLRPGDEVVVLPSGRRTRVRSIVTQDGELTQAFPPLAVTVTLADEVDVSRGDMLVHPANLPHLERTFEAMVVWMGDAPLVPGKQCWVKHTTSLVPAQVDAVRYRLNVNTLHREDATELAMNEVGRCSVTATRPLAIDTYRQNRTTGGFIIIDRLSNVTVGAGMIVDRATSLKSLRDHWSGSTSATRSQARQTTVDPAERQARVGHPPATLLLTGLSGAGKTTLAYTLERRLFDAGCSVCVLDGQQMRETISRDLGFSAPERSENLRRAIDVARVLNEAGLICICAFMAPSAEVREKARAAIGAERFLEIYLSAPVEVCRARDTEGLYAAADRGETNGFPGVTAPYDVPKTADLILDTERLDVEACTARLLDLLRARGILKMREG